MPGFLMPIDVKMKCMHQGTAAIAPSQPRVLMQGKPVATMASLMTVAGCPFQIPVGAGTKPQPCVTIKWAMPSTRFKILGVAAALLPAPGPGPATCRSVEQAPQGAPVIAANQIHVMGT